MVNDQWEAGRAPALLAIAAETPQTCARMSERTIDEPPAGPEGWREVWAEDRRYPVAGGGVKGLVTGWLRGLQRRVMRADEERQRNFNLAVLEMLDDQRRELPAALGRAVADMGRELAALRASLEELLRAGVERNDALYAAIDRKAEIALARIRDLSTPLLEGTASPSFREEWIYRRLEEGLRGSDTEVREALAPWVEHARGHAPVIDVGCGRGEFLDLCRAAGIEARGFDTNERSVAELRRRGLEAGVGGVPECLRPLGDGSAGSILATHVVEHLPFELLLPFFAEAKRVLRPGGLLMIETPNAESHAMSASDFWRDPTHLAPRHVAALMILARELGFEAVEVKTVHPFSASRKLHAPEGASPDVRELVHRLNAVLFGDQDLRLVLRKG